MYHAVVLQLRNSETQQLRAPCAAQHNHQSMMRCCGFVWQQHDCGVCMLCSRAQHEPFLTLPQLFTIGFGRSMHRMACIVAPAVSKDAKAAAARAASTPCFSKCASQPTNVRISQVSMANPASQHHVLNRLQHTWVAGASTIISVVP